MADAAPKEDSPHVANLKFREKELVEKVKRFEGMSDSQFDAGQGMNRKQSIDRAKSALASIRKQLK